MLEDLNHNLHHQNNNDYFYQILETPHNLFSFLNLFGKYIKNDYVYKGVVLFTGIIGLIESLESLGIENYYTNSILEILPFSDYGLTWLFPGLIGYILFSFMFRKVENKL